MAKDPYGTQYRKALDRAAAWHADHSKKGSGIPYISHLLTVSALVWEDGGDEIEAIAALLHDTVEDEKSTLDEVRDEFGDQVAAIVEDCSDAAPGPGEDKAPWFQRKVDHITHLHEITSLDRATSTMRVVGADKLANVRTVLVDHRAGKADLWGRFKGGLGGSAWYYAEMVRLVGEVLPDSMLARELGLAVGALDDVMAERTSEFHGLDSRIGSVLGDVVVAEQIDATRYLAFELARSVSEASDDLHHGVATVLLKWLDQAHPGIPSRDDLGDLVDLFDQVSGVAGSV